MKIELHLRRFAVTIQARDTGEASDNFIVLDKSQLQAAGQIGQSSKELITRAYAGMGYDVVSIGRADKLTVSIDLEELWRQYSEYQEKKVRWVYQHGGRTE